MDCAPRFTLSLNGRADRKACDHVLNRGQLLWKPPIDPLPVDGEKDVATAQADGCRGPSRIDALLMSMPVFDARA